MHAEGSRQLTEFDQVNIKDLNQEELLTNLLEAGSDWKKQEKSRVVRAFGLANYVHRHDEHRDQPYMYHILRSASRIPMYLHLNNPDLIVGSLLHDTVEHDPAAVIRYVPPGARDQCAVPEIPDDPLERQLMAFDNIARHFSVRASRIVRGKTNRPTGINKTTDREGWLREYLEHTAEEIRDPDVFFVQWTDWADNGLSRVYSNENLPTLREERFKQKYGLVMPLLQERFSHIDIQALLDDGAKQNVQRSFQLAYERLYVPRAREPLGSIAILSTMS